MRKSHESAIARLTMVALLVGSIPSIVGAEPGGARIEGLLIDVEGRAASGYTVHLIDEQGSDVAAASASDSGVYSLRNLPEGEYSIGIESPDGRMAPVASSTVRVSGNQLARRDIKLMQASADARQSAVGENYSIGMWWAGLSPQAKVWTVVGAVVVLGITIAAIDDEDDASPN
jgi:hypothetical protein